MKIRISYLFLVMSLLTLTGLVFESSVSAQPTATVTVTNTSMFTFFNTTTITTSALFTQYTTTTSSALSSQMQGTTVTQYLTQTLVTNNIVENSMTTMSLTTSTVVNTETENITILASAWGELFVAALVVLSAFSVVVPRILTYTTRGRSWICGKCGFSNPAFARSFCIRCGSAFSKPK